MPGLCLRAAARVACLQVHSYVAVPQGKTTYLSEVASGASALIASHSGATRTAVVGRAKVERRSLVCLSLESVKCVPGHPADSRHSSLALVCCHCCAVCRRCLLASASKGSHAWGDRYCYLQPGLPNLIRLSPQLYKVKLLWQSHTLMHGIGQQPWCVLHARWLHACSNPDAMQVLVEAETADGLRHSVLLQNAETVRLIGPGRHLDQSACC